MFITNLTLAQKGWAQFVNIDAGLEPLNRGAMQWGDYDKDGDLDLLSSGCGILNAFNDDCDSGFHTYLYRNDEGAFVRLNPGITGVSSGNVQWGDYDNDGDLDVLVVGRRGGDFAPVAEIYRNTGSSVFASIDAGLVAVKFGTGIWGDYDTDGDLDVLISGRDINNNRVTQLYRNNNGSFDPVSAGFPNMDISSASWVDFDGDGDLDLFMNGNAGSGKETRLFSNQGNGTFSETAVAMQEVEWASSDWGDYDNDGDPDLLLAGIGDVGAQTRIYRNTNGVFTDIGAGLTGTGRGNGIWGDYDNDGLLDILLVGLTDAGKSAKVYRNLGSGMFSLVQNLDTVDYGAAAWGDYDGDGDLDIALSGLIEDGSVAAIYRNDGAGETNTPPAVPAGLNVNVTNPEAVVFSWNPASDGQTDGNALTYALRVGTSPGGSEVLAASASNTGQRMLAQNGNAGYATRLTLRNMAEGTYYWSVQSVDQGFAGSAFANEQSFQITDGSPMVSAIPPVNVLEDAGSTVIQLADYFEDQQDGDNLIFTVESNSNALLVGTSIQSGELTLTYAENLSGSASLQVKGEDTEGKFAIAPVTITVSAVNDAPAFQRGDNLSILENAGPQIVTGWATSISAGPEDEQAQQLSFELTTEQEHLFEALPMLSINGDTGDLTYTPAVGDTGTAIVNVQLVDDGGTENGGIAMSTVQSFTISIGLSNSAPNIQALDDVASPAHNEPLALQTTVTDLENNLARVFIRWHLNDQLQAELPMINTTASIYSAELPGLPGASRVALTVVAEDSLGLTDSTQVPTSYVVRPAVPMSVEATFQEGQTVITWAASVGADSYNVYKIGDAGLERVGTSLADTTYLEAGSSSTSVARFQVAAVNEGGESGFSEEVLAPLCSPESPALTALAGPERVVLSWEYVSGCTVAGFTLRRDGEEVATLPADAVMYADEDLQATASYSYTLQALGLAGVDSPPSAVVDVMPFAYPAEITLNNGGKSFGDYTRPTSYRLVGVPGDANLPLASTTEGRQREDWNAFRDNGNASENPDEYLVEYSSALPELFVLEAGKGFWIVQKSLWTVQGETSTVPLDLDNTFTIDLQPGWNIITNPFDEVVGWDDVMAANASVAPSLESIWAFDGVFSESTTMVPYEGYYFFNGRTPALEGLKIPHPATGGSKTHHPSAKKTQTRTSTLTLRATSESGRQVVVNMGISDEAKQGLDELDRFGPPPAFSGISMRLYNEELESSYKWLAEEYRNLADDGQVFELEISVGNAGEKIQFDLEGMQHFEDEEIRFVDLQRGTVYTFDRQFDRQSDVWIESTSEKARFYLVIGDQAFVDKISSAIVPSMLSLAQNYPNPFSHNTTIVYTLPTQEHVKLTVYNMLGQRVATLVDQVQSAGRYEVGWGETMLSGVNMPSGVYLYQLSVGGINHARTMILRK